MRRLPVALKTAAFAALLLPVVSASAATMLFDFEGPDGSKGVTLANRPHYSYTVTNAFATSGARAYRLRFDPWREGLEQYGAYNGPTLTVPERLSDWRGYDRLSFDVVTTAAGGDLLSLMISSTNNLESKKFRFDWAGHGYGFKRFVIPLDKWSADVHADCVRWIRFLIRMPQATDIYIDNMALYKPGEEIPPPDGRGIADDLMPFLGERVQGLLSQAVENEREIRHGASMRAFLSDCAAKGTIADGMVVGQARSTERVMPRDAFVARAADAVSVRLARNETESFQIVVATLGEDLRDVGVAVEGDLVGEDGKGAFAAANIKPCVTGFGNVYEQATYRMHPGCRARLGWYPDPILDFLKTTDVKGDDVQSFWVRVKAPEGQAAGVFKGALLVSATRTGGGRTLRRVPLTVRVNGFALPKTSPLPLLLSFNPKVDRTAPLDAAERKKINEDPSSTVNIWRKHFDEWVDFLADYYITMDTIYMGSTKAFNETYLPAWKRLKKQGRLGWHCIGYWKYIPEGPDGERRWNDGNFAMLKANYETLKREGLLEDAYFYGADEVPMKFIENCRRAAELIKRDMPGVPITTTGCTRGGGVKGTPGERLGDVIDMFIPTTEGWLRGIADPAKVRADGRQLGWYICNNPDYPYAQMFTESEPIESRLLMGAMTAKYDPAAFLIWALTEWNYGPVVDSGPYTGIRERTWTTDNGDACWMHAGPDGVPLATVRLENFRDGLDDLWYAKLYEKKFGRKPDVPTSLINTLNDFSRDPVQLAAWREALADALEK